MYKILLRPFVDFSIKTTTTESLRNERENEKKGEKKKRRKCCSTKCDRVKHARKNKTKTDCCTLLSVMIAFLPYLGYAKYKKL